MHIGQTLLLGFEGTDPSDKDVQELSSLIVKGHVGGLIFFKHNVTTPEKTRSLVNYFKNLQSPEPLILAIDEEGGAVQRLKGDGFLNFLSAKEVANLYTPQEAYPYYLKMASKIKEFGFNLNLAPVVDLDPISGEVNEVLGHLGRTFSHNPQIVSEYAQAHIRAHKQRGVLTALKHFPGHGRVPGDTHTRTVDSTQTWTEEEIAPYKNLSDSGAMVMVSHVSHAVLTQSLPGPFSSHLINHILRKQINFQGVVVSDDLFMQGAASENIKTAGLRALEAGCDLLIFSYHPSLCSMVKGSIPPYGELIEGLEQEYQKNNRFKAQVQKSLQRLKPLKQSLYDSTH